MSPVFSLAKTCVQLAVVSLLLQFGDMPPDQPGESPFARQTTPPAQFLVFNSDFSSLDKARFMQWIHPARGLVKNGILLTKEEADASFYTQSEDDSRVLSVNIAFNYGEFAGANTYQADCWVEYKAADQAGEDWYRFHNIFVFEIIDAIWYLVQSEYVAPNPDISIPLESAINRAENVPPELRQFVAQYTTPVVSSISAWPLLIGSRFATGSELHPIEGKLMDGRSWTLRHAVAQGKPTVLVFISIYSLLVAPQEELNGTMGFLSRLYSTFGHRDLYIFGVTDEPRDKVVWFGESGYDDFAPLLDDGSDLHAALNIDIEPYIVVFDAQGTVIALTKTFHPSGWGLVEDRIRAALAAASRRG